MRARPRVGTKGGYPRFDTSSAGVLRQSASPGRSCRASEHPQNRCPVLLIIELHRREHPLPPPSLQEILLRWSAPLSHLHQACLASSRLSVLASLTAQAWSGVCVLPEWS